ncbi:hypothetical protein LSS_21870 [Leptospira santarosai serovar Shermani str. LT 821]|uniref:Uncharacterized protein n=1 Tax=Leptospira santarosai serovar Shermani str. LT 821 TaxID=758847 RepID=A0A097ESL5_9LEPT|nr:hypothetical protein LSS_21870 [Leptospira santarosai serovar Shermani str. LT 821]
MKREELNESKFHGICCYANCKKLEQRGMIYKFDLKSIN